MRNCKYTNSKALFQLRPSIVRILRHSPHTPAFSSYPGILFFLHDPHLPAQPHFGASLLTSTGSPSVQGTVGRTLQDLLPRKYLLPFPGREAEIQKPRPEALHGLPGRMHQILGVETVVPQFVQHDFVGWEVVRPPGIFSADPVDSQKQCALAELVAVGTVCLLYTSPSPRDRG